MDRDVLSTDRKALQINLAAETHGTFAEIGAGQEVARWFFHVGGAAGTVAKTISAYDMAVSDAIYGPAERYVSRQRLQAMLQYEFDLLQERLDPIRKDTCKGFVFADTVATRSFRRQEEGHGWLGIRFQAEPRSAPSDIIIHVRMLDREPARQQEALGVIGVNLIHGAFHLHRQPAGLLRSLLDNLTWERIEVDMVRVGGPAFAGVDNRLLALQLVEQDLTEAAMFTASGETVQWAEVLHRKPVLVQRGSFRPATRTTLDVLGRALAAFVREPEVRNEPPVVLMEMTLRHLATGDAIDHRDFLQRADMLRALGRNVLISNFRRLHRLAAYLGRYTDRPIGLALGAHRLAEVFDEGLYNAHEGGLLGGLGHLFRNGSRLYVYPSLDFSADAVVTVENFPIAPHLRHLYRHLTENGCLRGLPGVDLELLRIRAGDVLGKIAAGDPSWELLVPPPVADVIKRERLFGWRDAA